MRFRPISPELLYTELAERIAGWQPDERLRVVVDGAPAADPAGFADALVDPLRLLGRSVLRVSADDFLRPASLRFEHGRTDPDARYEDWQDIGALTREVLEPLGSGGSGQVLPTLWDAGADRATRAQYRQVQSGGVVLLDGALLLGRGLPIDLSIHLWLSEPALARSTAAEEHWMLPAFARYEREADPVRQADVVVRLDDARHPALRVPTAV